MRLVTAVKPTGKPTLGNLLGAIKPFVEMQKDYDETFLFIADLHALTLPIDPEELSENTKNLIYIYFAAGIDTTKTLVFRQSRVPAHNQLEWVLTCNTILGELTKMPQYKNFVENNKDKGIPAGMLLYPSLMNADILLYDADVVPVGMDQLPHIELCRDIAEKFNKRYPASFKLPKGITPKAGAKIMSLVNPMKKMSKSESDKGTIYLLDDIEISKKKIMKALTDSEDKVYYDPVNKPGISNLMTIYSCISGETFEEIKEKYKDAPNYGVFKRDLAELVGNELFNLQKKVESLKEQYPTVSALIESAEQTANVFANKKINEIYYKLGLR